MPIKLWLAAAGNNTSKGGVSSLEHGRLSFSGAHLAKTSARPALRFLAHVPRRERRERRGAHQDRAREVLRQQRRPSAPAPPPAATAAYSSPYKITVSPMSCHVGNSKICVAFVSSITSTLEFILEKVSAPINVLGIIQPISGLNALHALLQGLLPPSQEQTPLHRHGEGPLTFE